MKVAQSSLRSLLVVCIVVVFGVGIVVVAQPPTLLAECDFVNDCDKDTDCAPGLVCADEHKVELEDAGLDRRGAYCARLESKPPKNEVCYNQSKVETVDSPIPSAKLGECDLINDCDKDSDCVPGLLCADKHKDELEYYGLDPRGAYCENLEKKPWNYEVCYNPSKVGRCDALSGYKCGNALSRCNKRGAPAPFPYLEECGCGIDIEGLPLCYQNFHCDLLLKQKECTSSTECDISEKCMADESCCKTGKNHCVRSCFNSQLTY